MEIEVDWKRPRGYQDLIESVTQYNTNLTVDRVSSYPYVDGQTGIAMTPTDHLTRSRNERMPGHNPGQVYSYKPREWMVQYPVTTILDIGRRKKRKLDSRPEAQSSRELSAHNSLAVSSKQSDILSNHGSPYNMRSAGMGGTTRKAAEIGKRRIMDAGRDGSEPSDPDDSLDSDDSSEEEEAPRRTRGPSARGRGGMSRGGMGRKCKCIYCGKFFKNPTSLKTHYTKEHPGQSTSDLSSLRPAKLDVKVLKDTEAKAAKSSSKDVKVKPNQFCDFCYGTANNNAQTKKSERLISCADCGRSAHSSCLTFGPKIAMNVLTYRWQCMECKECILCGQTDNDEKLLFCDYCDRGYHMYCLLPPMSNPPEGVWICVLCQAKEEEEHKK